MLYQLVLVVHTLVAMAIISLVFLQHGKGADIGATFGGGASNTVFGSQGSGGVLYKATCVLAFVFCVTSISLTTILAYQRKVDISNISISAPIKATVPAETSGANINDVPAVKN